MPDKAIQTRIAERLREFKADFVPRVAELRRPVLGNVPVSKDERRRRWWQEAEGWTPEQELALLGFNPDGTPRLDPVTGQPAKPLSREDVGLLRWPLREIDARAAGKGDVRKEAQYAREMSDLGPPPPDTLETAAQGASSTVPTSQPAERGY